MKADGKTITQVQLSTQQPQEEIDLAQIFVELNEEYRNVFIANISNNIFIYRSLGRSEYAEIIRNENLDDMTKEDVICDLCTVYPQNFDFSKCSAGIVPRLTDEIIKNSLLDSLSIRRDVLVHYRQEMYELDNQISCLIHEAFPRFDIEEIEAWDVERTTKYLSRAEWILQNLRGVPFTDYIDLFSDEKDAPEVEVEQVKELPQEAQPSSPTRNMTEEQRRQYEEFKRKFPEIPWGEESVLSGNISKEAVNTISPALRTPDGGM